MRYIFPGDPVSLSRPRFGNGRVYHLQADLKRRYSIDLQRQHGDMELYTGPLNLMVEFYFPIPKRSKYAKVWHVFKPDITNCIKWVEDVANGIIYHDDCLIAAVQATKKYDKVARTEFEITCL
jgi:Holliday junction resolvase RusA-like endonuclease